MMDEFVVVKGVDGYKLLCRIDTTYNYYDPIWGFYRVIKELSPAVKKLSK